ncbi:unnamed protein product [Closterium sp. NIES-54]
MNEKEGEEAPAEPVPPKEDPDEVRVRYMRTSRIHANDDLWQKRLGHPSRVTPKNCIEAGVFAPGALLRPDGSKVRSTTQLRNCTICPEDAQSNQPREYRAWIILDLLSQKTTNACDVIFYERLNLAQFHEEEHTNANYVYTHDGHSYATPEDEATGAIQEQDTKGEFKGGDRHNSDDEHEDSPGGGAGGAGGSSKGAASPLPPEPESDDDAMQEVIPQHRNDSTGSGLQLLGLHAATSTSPCVIEPKNPSQALTGPHSKEWLAATARYRHHLLCLDLKPWPARNGTTAAAACNGTVAASACNGTTAGAACNGTVAAAACSGTVAAVTCNGTTKAVADGAASLKTYAVGSKETLNMWHARLGHVHFDAVKRTPTSGGV